MTSNCFHEILRAMNAPLSYLPEWMMPTEEKQSGESLVEEKERAPRHPLLSNPEITEQTMQIAHEVFLEKMGEGQTLDRICREYHIPISPTRYRTWCFRDKNRKAHYQVAQALGAEAIVDEMLRISDGIKADGTASLDDVARSTLRITTRKWLAGVYNRKKYGDIKHIEQTTTTKVDIRQLSTEELEQKLLRSLGVIEEDGSQFGNIIEGTVDPLAAMDQSDDG